MRNRSHPIHLLRTALASPPIKVGSDAANHWAKTRPEGPSLVWGGGLMLAFGVLMLAATEGLKRVHPQVLLGEGGLIEMAQLVLLALAAWTFHRAGQVEGRGSVFSLFSIAVSIAWIRELDGPLDRIWHGSWKVPAMVVAAVLLHKAWLDRRLIPATFARFAASPSSGLTFAAAGVILIQSRLLGRQSSWRGALEEEYVAIVPRLIEELSELGGYALLLIAAVEAQRWVAAAAAGESRQGSMLRGPLRVPA